MLLTVNCKMYAVTVRGWITISERASFTPFPKKHVEQELAELSKQEEAAEKFTDYMENARRVPDTGPKRQASVSRTKTYRLVGTTE